MNNPNPEYDYSSLGKVAAEIYRRRMGDVPDSELIISNRQSELPDYHWCLGCQWGTVMADRVMCPLAIGSCARMPETMDNLDPEAVHNRIKHYHNKMKGNA